MIDPDEKLIAECDRARQAQELADHPLFREALDAYKKQITDNWLASPARDKEGREALWLMLKTAEAVERHLVQIMETGKMATLQMEQKRSMLERARAWTGLD